ncbi:MAG: family 20 glycosylhydrolase [Clostridia bacterium]|nr:family 20 glycosylhydrolase [Clostridia bacterium]
MIPRVKEYKELGGCFFRMVSLPKTEDGEAAARLLSLFLPSLSVVTGETPTALLAKDPLPAGAYRLAVEREGIRITYGGYEGLRNAVATLAGLYTDAGFICAEIADAPAFGFRSAMLDLARGYVELPVLYEHLVRMAFLKYNVVHLHLMDSETYVMESAVVPNPEGHRQYTQAEMRRVCEFCRLLCLDVIPEIEFPTHATNTLLAVPALWCDILDPAKAEAAVSVPKLDKRLLARDRRASAWAVCLGSERTYEIYRRILAEIAAVFPGQYVHVGGDEIAYPHLGAVPHWDNCRACRARMEAEGLADTLALYHYGFRRLHAILSELGKRMIKWNEQDELGMPLPLPKDVIIEYWKPKDPGAVETAPEKLEAEKQLLRDGGFSLINAHYYYTYVDFASYMTAEKMNAWSPAAEGESMMGGETCAWELGNPRYSFYPYRLPISMALFADRLWNRDAVPYDSAYRAELFAAAVGKRGLGEAPMGPFPAVLPPTLFGSTTGVPPTLEAVPAAVDSLRGVDGEGVFGRLFLDAYRAYLETLMTGEAATADGTLPRDGAI